MCRRALAPARPTGSKNFRPGLGLNLGHGFDLVPDPTAALGGSVGSVPARPGLGGLSWTCLGTGGRLQRSVLRDGGVLAAHRRGRSVHTLVGGGPGAGPPPGRSETVLADADPTGRALAHRGNDRSARPRMVRGSALLPARVDDPSGHAARLPSGLLALLLRRELHGELRWGRDRPVFARSGDAPGESLGALPGSTVRPPRCAHVAR